MKERSNLEEKVANRLESKPQSSLSIEQAINLLIEEKMSVEGSKKQQPTLVAVYGLPHAGKSHFIKEFNKELSKNKERKLFAGVIHTSDNPEGDLKQLNDLKKIIPN